MCKMRKDPERKKKLTENLFNLNTILDLDPEAEKNPKETKGKDPSPENEKIGQPDDEEIIPESYWYEEDDYQIYPADDEKENQKHSPEKLENEEEYQRYTPEDEEENQRYTPEDEEENLKQSPEKLVYEEDEKAASENLLFSWDEGLIPDEDGYEEKRESYAEDSLISPYNIHLNEQKILDEEYRKKLKDALDLLKSLKPNPELISAINLIEDVVKGRK
jgi:hypothetical protein